MAITMEELKRKAKAYDEVLESAKDIVNNQNASSVWKDWLRNTFPELKENKGEEIRKLLIRLFTSNTNEKFDDVSTEEIIAWLEKQEEPTDSVKPKFHEGDWIISNNKKYIYQVVEVKRGIYVIRDNADNHEYHVGIESADRDGGLWNISDAKDGDVLVNGSNIFIFHFINDTRLMGYCHVNTDDGRFYDDIGKNECFCLIDAVVNPATKEQRDTLMKAMNDAGWEFDFEKKELKKLSQQEVTKISDQDRVGCEANCTTTKGWNEGDEKMLDNCINALGDSSFVNTYEIEEWVKSLRQRMGG